MYDTISEAVGTKSKSSLKDTATYHRFNITSSDCDVLQKLTMFYLRCLF
jgi:hypothetical protein